MDLYIYLLEILKSAISFNIKQPNPKHIDYFTDDWIVEIDNLNSLKKDMAIS